MALPDSLDLRTALSYALEHNYDILQAKQRIEEQNGLIVEVRARALPELTVDGRYLELDEGLSEPNGFFPPTETQWAVALNARQTLYAGGGVRAALEVQNYLEQSVLFELQAYVNNVLLQVREGFYTALLNRERIEVQTENIALLQEQLANAEARFEVGTVSKFEVLRAQVNLANGRPALIQAENAYRLAIEELRQTLGFRVAAPGDLERVPELLGELAYWPNDYELGSSLKTAVAQRPELRQLEVIRDAREKGIVIAKSGHRPEVSLVGSYQVNKSFESSRLGDGLKGWTAGLEVSIPVFDGRRTRGQVIQAKAQAEQARLLREQTALAVEVQLRRALSDLQEAQELANASIQVTGQAEEALRQARARYAAGEATQLDVFQSQVALTQSRLNESEAVFRYNVAEARLRNAMGVADPVVRTE